MKRRECFQLSERRVIIIIRANNVGGLPPPRAYLGFWYLVQFVPLPRDVLLLQLPVEFREWAKRDALCTPALLPQTQLVLDRSGQISRRYPLRMLLWTDLLLGQNLPTRTVCIHKERGVGWCVRLVWQKEWTGAWLRKVARWRHISSGSRSTRVDNHCPSFIKQAPECRSV